MPTTQARLAGSQATVSARAGDAVVIYSLATGRVRRWLVPDEDGHLLHGAIKGEGVMHVPARYSGNILTLQSYVTTRTGLTPAHDRYVIIDRRTTTIVGALIADPACGDAVPGCDLVQHDMADGSWTVAWTHDGAAFTAPPMPTYTQAQLDAFAAQHGGG